MNQRTVLRRFAIAFWFVLGTAKIDAAPGVVLTLQEPWSNVFAGKQAVYHVMLAADEPFDGRVIWRLSADNRTLARGEQVAAAHAGAPAAVEIRLDVPPVNPGVVMQTTLSLGAVAAGSDAEVCTLHRTIWVFAENAFVERSEWLKSLGIRLFDPSGKTAALFAKAGIPCVETRNVDALPAIDRGMVIIGEGVSFKEYRGLAEILMRTAAGGRPVLCLTPESGEMPLRGPADAAGAQPRQLTFARRDIVKRLDKRLDADGWRSDRAMADAHLCLKGDRGGVVMEAGREAGGWSWMEMDFDKGNGKLVVCSLEIVGAWEESPTPRFLLARMLEYVSGNKAKE